jgi:GcrA cell cycle regulator
MACRPAEDCGEAFCLERQYLYNYADKHRADFPVRQKKERKPVYHYVGTKTPSPPRVYHDRLPKLLPPDRVRRTTISGAVVTLPRIPTIDGYAS